MNNQKKIRLVLIASIVIFFSLLLFSIINTIERKNQIVMDLEEMPEFELFQLNGNLFTRDSLDKTCHTIFIYYHTDCDFCQHEIESILENRICFKQIQLVLISPEEISSIRNFAEERELTNVLHIRLLQDAKMNFAAQFDIDTTPYTLIYDKGKRRIRRIKGQILYKTITKELQNYEKKQTLH